MDIETEKCFLKQFPVQTKLWQFFQIEGKFNQQWEVFFFEREWNVLLKEFLILFLRYSTFFVTGD